MSQSFPLVTARRQGRPLYVPVEMAASASRTGSGNHSPQRVTRTRARRRDLKPAARLPVTTLRNRISTGACALFMSVLHQHAYNDATAVRRIVLLVMPT